MLFRQLENVESSEIKALPLVYEALATAKACRLDEHAAGIGVVLFGGRGRRRSQRRKQVGYSRLNLDRGNGKQPSAESAIGIRCRWRRDGSSFVSDV